MTTAVLRTAGVVVARDATRDLCAALGLPLIAEARPGADLSVRAARGLPFPPPGRLLRAADGWVHPGPPTVWDTFSAMAISLGAPVPATPHGLPDLRSLPAEVVDAEAGEWRLPAVAVRAAGAAPEPVRAPRGPVAISEATVLVLGTAWAVPLTGLVLARLGAHVVRIENPRRDDPFPLRDALASGQTRLAIDLDDPDGRDAFVAHLEAADLLVDGNTPRVFANLGLDDAALHGLNPRLSVVRLAAFATEDRPGYGLAAECRGGWVARVEPPRLARTSVADPVAGLLAALAAVDALARPGARERVSLEGAVGHLLSEAVPSG
jgi:CoA-transferase family III